MTIATTSHAAAGDRIHHSTPTGSNASGSLSRNPRKTDMRTARYTTANAPMTTRSTARRCGGATPVIRFSLSDLAAGVDRALDERFLTDDVVDHVVALRHDLDGDQFVRRARCDRGAQRLGPAVADRLVDGRLCDQRIIRPGDRPQRQAVCLAG